jgi:hypothetical protein
VWRLTAGTANQRARSLVELLGYLLSRWYFMVSILYSQYLADEQGHTATREITFRSVCETIRDYAFVARYATANSGHDLTYVQ